MEYKISNWFIRISNKLLINDIPRHLLESIKFIASETNWFIIPENNRNKSIIDENLISTHLYIMSGKIPTEHPNISLGAMVSVFYKYKQHEVYYDSKIGSNKLEFNIDLNLVINIGRNTPIHKNYNSGTLDTPYEVAHFVKDKIKLKIIRDDDDRFDRENPDPSPNPNLSPNKLVNV